MGDARKRNAGQGAAVPAVTLDKEAKIVEWAVFCRGEVFPASEMNARSLVCHDRCADPVVVRRTVRVSGWSPVEPEVSAPQDGDR